MTNLSAIDQSGLIANTSQEERESPIRIDLPDGRSVIISAKVGLEISEHEGETKMTQDRWYVVKGDYV